MQFYRPKHFKLYELVPKATLAHMGERAWLLLDHRILIAGDQVRDFFGAPCTVNTWHDGGDKDSRGWRPGDDPDGAEHSQHKYGRALDLIIQGVTGAEARDVILNHQEHFPFISRIEDGTPHLHFDCAPVFHRGIYLFDP